MDTETYKKILGIANELASIDVNTSTHGMLRVLADGFKSDYLSDYQAEHLNRLRKLGDFQKKEELFKKYIGLHKTSVELALKDLNELAGRNRTINKSNAPYQFIEFRQRHLKILFDGILPQAVTTALTQGQKNTATKDSKKVFIVHGRDIDLRDNLSMFLKSLKLSPMQWTEGVSATGKPTPFTEDVINAAFENAQAIVVLLSPDEKVFLKEEFKQVDDAVEGYRPRPNVIYETGIAMALHSERTLVIEAGNNLEISDLKGRNVIKINERNEVDLQQRESIISRLHTCGCLIDDSDGGWKKTARLTPTSRVEPENNSKGSSIPGGWRFT